MRSRDRISAPPRSCGGARRTWGWVHRSGRSRATTAGSTLYPSPGPSRPSMVFARVALVLAGVLAGSTLAEAGTVALAVDACVPADRAQLDRLVALELAAAAP